MIWRLARFVLIALLATAAPARAMPEGEGAYAGLWLYQGDSHAHYMESRYLEDEWARWMANLGHVGNAQGCGQNPLAVTCSVRFCSVNSNEGVNRVCTSDSGCTGDGARCLDPKTIGHVGLSYTEVVEAARSNGLDWIVPVNHASHANFKSARAWMQSPYCVYLRFIGAPEEFSRQDVCGGWLLPNGSRTLDSWELTRAWSAYYNAQHQILVIPGIEFADTGGSVDRGHVIALYDEPLPPQPCNQRSGNLIADGLQCSTANDFINWITAQPFRSLLIASHPGASPWVNGKTNTFAFHWEQFTPQQRAAIDAVEVDSRWANPADGSYGVQRIWLPKDMNVCRYEEPVKSYSGDRCTTDAQCGGVPGACLSGLGLMTGATGSSDVHARPDDILKAPGALGYSVGYNGRRSSCWLPVAPSSPLTTAGVMDALEGGRCYMAARDRIIFQATINGARMGDSTPAGDATTSHVVGFATNTVTNMTTGSWWMFDGLRIYHNGQLVHLDTSAGCKQQSASAPLRCDFDVTIPGNPRGTWYIVIPKSHDTAYMLTSSPWEFDGSPDLNDGNPLPVLPASGALLLAASLIGLALGTRRRTQAG